MKKIILALLVLLIAAAVVPVTYAEEISSGSKFDNALMQKNSLLIREITDFTSIVNDNGNEITFQTAVLTDITSGTKYCALQIDYFYSYSEPHAVALLDIDEIDDAIMTLQYIKDHIEETDSYTKITYTCGSGAVIGAEHDGSRKRILIQQPPELPLVFEISDADNLITILQTAKATLESKMTEAEK